ncbi:Alpha/Beta hydrolase protein [Halenospora varia]|nr:Alpha/Beta hydrolase protein [Halenospora varia]
MDTPLKSFTTSRSLTYTYLHIPSSTTISPRLPTILFLHGFPSSIHDYSSQIEHFSSKGYGIVAPELLGYSGSSKPKEIEAYSGKGMSRDVYELVRSLGLEDGEVLGVGHDWGSFLLSRLQNYYPALFSKLVFLDVGYSAPGNNLTVEKIKFIDGMVKQHLGYSVFGYFLFFDEEGAGELLNENVDSALTLFHSKDYDIMKKYMGAEGGAREWFENKMTTPTPSYLTEEDKAQFQKQFSSEPGFTAALNWYRAQLHDANADDEAALPAEAAKIKQPVLLIGGDNPITASADFPKSMKESCEDLRVEIWGVGHWIMMEEREKCNRTLETFFEN